MPTALSLRAQLRTAEQKSVCRGVVGLLSEETPCPGRGRRSLHSVPSGHQCPISGNERSLLARNVLQPESQHSSSPSTRGTLACSVSNLLRYVHLCDIRVTRQTPLPELGSLHASVNLTRQRAACLTLQSLMLYGPVTSTLHRHLHCTRQGSVKRTVTRSARVGTPLGEAAC